MRDVRSIPSIATTSTTEGRLVEHGRLDPMGSLQCLATTDEDAGLRPTSGADHHGRGRRQAHRARARDHDDADERGQCEREARLGTGDEPDHEGRGGQEQDQRDEGFGDPIGQVLDRRLAALSAANGLDDPRERRVMPDPGRTHHERPGPVHRPADDLGAGSDLDRHRLAGEHARVDARCTLEHDAVDRHLVAGPDANTVADGDLNERDVGLTGVGDDPRGRRLQPDETSDRAGRTGLRATLEPPAEEHEADDDRRCIEVGLRMEASLVDRVREERDTDAVEPRGARPDGDERVHVRRPVPEGPPRGAVEPSAGEELDDGRGNERDPVQRLHRDPCLRDEHHDHDPDGDDDRDDGLS
jgi:hypothetical protein